VANRGKFSRFATPLWIIYALWAMLFYQLVFTAWTLEYSIFGVIGVIAASVLFIYIFPSQDRRTMIRFTLFSLAVSLAIPSFASESLLWRILDYVVFVVFALFLGRWLLKMKLTRLLLVIVSITLAELWVPLADMSVLANFQVQYTGHLGSQDPQIPSIPVAAAGDAKRPGLQQIITLQEHRPYKGEAQQLIGLLGQPGYSTSVQDAIKELQHSYDLVSITPGQLRYHLSYPSLATLKQLSFSRMGLADFPFTTSHFLNVYGKTRMYLSLSQSPGSLLEMVLNPGNMAKSISALSLQTAAAEASNWDALTGRNRTFIDGLTLDRGYLSGNYHGATIHVKTAGVVLMGVYPLLPKSVSPLPEAIVEGNNVIQVITLLAGNAHVIATLHGTFNNPLTTDVVFADLLHSGTDELLVNSVPAQILRLTPRATWQTLWVSQRDSFRFESVFPKPGGDLMIANSPGLDTNSPVRYLGGYRYLDGQLVNVFRVYHNDLVSIHTVHITTASAPELLTSVYAHQEIMLLKPTTVPWLLLVELSYVLVIGWGLYRRIRKGARLV